MNNKKLKELIEWQDAGNEVESRVRRMSVGDNLSIYWSTWTAIKDSLSNFLMKINGTKFVHEFRKKEKQKLTREQIMNEWLWDKNSMVAFKVVCVDGYNCYKVIKGENIMSNFEYIQTYCELYTNQENV